MPPEPDRDPHARILERSPGTSILFAYADTLGALEVTIDAGEHPDAIYHLRRAADSLEHAHKTLIRGDGSAIIRPGEPEPVDTRGRLPWKAPAA